MRVAHIADVHVLDKRREEYAAAFARLAEQLTHARPDAIAIAGDIFDGMTRATASNWNDVAALLQRLAEIAPVVIIAGNHDLNLRAPGNPDLISPLLSAAGGAKDLQPPAVTYFRHAGCYTHLGAVWCVGAPDEPLPEPAVLASYLASSAAPPDAPVVALFHEAVHRARYPTGQRAESDRLTPAYLAELAAVSGPRPVAVLLGDIHLQQAVPVAAPNVAAWYPGSLLCQNFGEAHLGHGWLEWDLTCNPPAVAAHEVPNPNAVCTFELSKGRDVTPQPVPTAPRAWRLRHDADTSQEELDAQIAALTLAHGPPREVLGPKGAAAVEYSNRIGSGADDDTGGTSPASVGTVSATEAARAPQAVLEAMWEYLCESGVPEAVAEAVIARHRQATAQHTSATAGRPILKRLEFSNLYCFGENNVVDFAALARGPPGLVGLVAPNRAGKSSFYDILAFAMTDAPPRGRKDSILRKGATRYDLTLDFELDGRRGRVEKNGTANANKMRVWYDGVELTEAKLTETAQSVRGLLGRPDHLEQVSFFRPGDSPSFTLADAKTRRAALAALLDLGYFVALKTEADKQATALRAQVKAYDEALQNAGVAAAGESAAARAVATAQHVADAVAALPDRETALQVARDRYRSYQDRWQEASQALHRAQALHEAAAAAAARCAWPEDEPLPEQTADATRADNAEPDWHRQQAMALAEELEALPNVAATAQSTATPVQSPSPAEINAAVEMAQAARDARARAAAALEACPPGDALTPLVRLAMASLQSQADDMLFREAHTPLPQLDMDVVAAALAKLEADSEQQGEIVVVAPDQPRPPHAPAVYEARLAELDYDTAAPAQRIAAATANLAAAAVRVDAASAAVAATPAAIQTVSNIIARLWILLPATVRPQVTRTLASAMCEGAPLLQLLRAKAAEEDAQAALVQARERAAAATSVYDAARHAERRRQLEADLQAAREHQLHANCTALKRQVRQNAARHVLHQRETSRVAAAEGDLAQAEARLTTLRAQSAAAERARLEKRITHHKAQARAGTAAMEVQRRATAARLADATTVEETAREAQHAASAETSALAEECARLQQLAAQEELCARLVQDCNELEVVLAYREALDPAKGVSVRLLQSAREQLNNTINQHLRIANADFQCQLDTDFELRLEGAVSDPQLASGYQRFVLELAARGALTELARVPLPSMLLVDEGFGTLDEANLGRVAEGLETLALTPVGGREPPQVLAVSHRDDLRSYFAQTLEIESGPPSRLVFPRAATPQLLKKTTTKTKGRTKKSTAAMTMTMTATGKKAAAEKKPIASLASLAFAPRGSTGGAGGRRALGTFAVGLETSRQPWTLFGTGAGRNASSTGLALLQRALRFVR